MATEIIASDEGFSERLEYFLKRYRSLAHKSLAHPSIDRLQTLLRNLKPLLKDAKATKLPTRPVVALDLSKLKALFLDLREQLLIVRKRGDLVDIWSIAGLKRNEVRNCAVLAWLLSPRGSHGQGHDILKAFLNLAAGQKRWVFDDADLARATVRTEHYPLADSQNRVDIVIDGPSFLAFVEVKIDASEGTEQLSRYMTAAQFKQSHQKDNGYLIYLSPKAPDQNSVLEFSENFSHITWPEVAKLLKSDKTKHVSKTHSQIVINGFGHHIQHFI